MMAHDQRTGARGMPSFPAGLFSPRMPSQGPRVIVLTLVIIFKKMITGSSSNYDEDCNDNQEKNTAEALVSSRGNLKKWS